ncbi:MAG: allantoicase [Pseudomonadota bacterium]|jgi:allantoicase|nr:allantoicase [Pseudomonadota bacterium]
MSTDIELCKRFINIADERLGASALFATDDFFAPKERMLKPAEPIWREGVYDDHGKWMDGWESRRRRDQAHDYCIVQLAAPATLAALDIDTRHFTGNYPPLASVQACRTEHPPDLKTDWTVLLPQTALVGNQHNVFALSSPGVWTHLKLNIFPDGGVARFRAYGRIVFDWTEPTVDSAPIDLAAALHGGRALACSDEHYGSMHNVLLPGRATSMADGWETRRRREPGFDWLILQLGHSGRIHHIDIDTAHFKGNFPHQVSIQGALLQEEFDAHAVMQSMYWAPLLEPQLLNPDREHRFQSALHDFGPISHLRINIHPDGGVSRIRVFGHPHGP